MATLHKNEVAGHIDNMRARNDADSEAFDLSLQFEVQTDKDMVKLVPCRECQRPLVVTTFFAPAKAICRSCKGEAPDSVATVGQPVPGQTDPAKAVNLKDCLVNKQFEFARCPVHPDDEEHVMELKSVSHNDHYGPTTMIGYEKGQPVYRQDAPGETVMHQCTHCKATVVYSTKHVVQYKRINEVKVEPDFGPPHRNSLLGVRDEHTIEPLEAVEA